MDWSSLLFVAYDDDCNKKTNNSDDILKRMALAQVKSVDISIMRSQSDSPDHDQLINYTMQFGGMTDPAAAKPEPCWRWIRYNTNVAGTTTFIQRIEDFGIFDMAKWNQSGYKNASDYAKFAHNATIIRLGGQ